MPDFANDAWEATYPEGWASEQSEDSVIFFDTEAEAGTLQVSCICGDEPVTEEDLLAMADELVTAGKRYTRVELGNHEGIMFRYYAGEESWKEWYLAAGHCMFFATYDCPREVEGVEDEEVVQILESLRVTAK
jgi:hypothetical protein